MLRHFIFLLAVFYIANGVNSAQNQQNKRNKNKNVLFISTNHRPDHFIINCDFASVLARHYNVVCYLFSQT